MSLIRIVFSDIDGTLLNKERALSEATKTEIKRLKTLDIPFILASSRMPKAMRYFLDECGVDFPMICYNGALVLGAKGNHTKERVIFSQTIPFGVLMAIAAFWTDSPIHLSVFRNDEWFTEDEDEWMTREARNTRVSPSILPMATLVEMWQVRQMGPHKIMCMGDEEELTILHTLLTDRFKNQVVCYRPKATYLEISPDGVSKSIAAELVMMENGLDFRVAAAFGDQVNDLDLITSVSYGVAMANAPEFIRKAARRIAPANTEDGVATLLRDLIK